MRGIASMLVLAAAGCAGARPKGPESLPALCVLEGPAANDPTPQTWLRFLLRGYDPKTQRTTTPALDCTGAHVRWEGPALRCSDSALAATALPDRRLTGEDVVVADARDGATLVWIATTSYGSGDASGPVALVFRSSSGLKVVATGVLRSFRRNVKLSLERIGPVAVLAAESDACASREEARCGRVVRLIPFQGAHFVPTPLVREDGRCLSPALLDLNRSERVRSRDGWELAELTAAPAFGPGGLEVQEQVLVRDGEGGPVLRRAQTTRTIQWSGERLVSSEEPLWARMVSGAR